MIKNLCHNEITIKPKGRDFKNYNEIVEMAMELLKERLVCSSSRKFHKDCYEAFGGFMEKETSGSSQKLLSPHDKENKGNKSVLECV